MKIKEQGRKVLSSIAELYSAVHDIFIGSSTYEMLDRLHRKQVGKNIELSGQVGKLSYRNEQLSTQLEKRTLELEVLKAKQGELRTLLAVTKRDINETLELAYEVRTAEKAIKARAKANASANGALVEWQENYAGPLERKLRFAEQEVTALRSVTFKTAIDITLKGDPKIGKIPFAYYDFVNSGFCYTPATLNFIGAGEEKDTLTLKQLVGYIRKEDREVVISSLKSGKGLRHYKALTSGENPKELVLTTKPFFYDKKPVGVAIFLFDTKYSVKNFKDHLVYKRLNKLFNQLSGEFETLKENIKQGKLEVSF